MIYDQFYNTHGHSYEEYEKSHKQRLDFLVEDLELNQLVDKKIVDIGCGLGFIWHRLSSNIRQNYYGYDGSALKNPPFSYIQADLDNFDTKLENFFDIALCFETLEHLTNPYACLLETKKILKPDALLFLTIPEERTTHNTIYPGLLYPKENFEIFLRQMAFQIQTYRLHTKCFSQHVYTLINKDWSDSQMFWHKPENKFRNIPPHVAINL